MFLAVFLSTLYGNVSYAQYPTALYCFKSGCKVTIKNRNCKIILRFFHLFVSLGAL